VGDDELDLDRFERLRAAGRFEEALALWRGPALADLAGQRFAAAESAHLEELQVACVEERIERELALGRHAQVVGELEALVAEHPHRERLRGQLVLTLYRSGRQADALEAFAVARRTLVDELGIEPGRELRDLHQAVLRQDPRLDLPSPTAPERAGYVGRTSELAELERGLDDASAGRGRLFLLVGEPGIGKSRLADELLSRARARGARVLVGRCWEAGGAPAYWPWLQALGAGDLPFPAATGASDADPDAARFRLFEAVTGLLRSETAERPIALFLDDLHAADTPSLLLLRFLARELGPMRMLVACACRDVDPVPGLALSDLLADLAREPVTRRLTLRGLSDAEVAEYVELAAADLASDELVTAVTEETEGNPLFLGEILRLLAAEGLPTDSPDGIRLAIPEGVREVIARRLARLSEPCHHVLVLASVFGREFTPDALAQVAGAVEDELLDLLDEASVARVVAEVPGAPDRMRFAHVLIRDTLYDGVSGPRRVRLHQRVVARLEALYAGEPGPHLAQLAHHAMAGCDFAAALRYARGAGDRALALLAFEEAARLYATALEALDAIEPDDARQRCELMLTLGEAHARAGNMPAAQEAFLEAAGIARALDVPRARAQAAAGYGGRIIFARGAADDRLVALLEEGLEAIGDDDPPLRVRLLARLAGALRDEPIRDRRDTLSAEALEIARRIDDPVALAHALDGRASAIVAPDTIEEVLALGNELLRVAERSGNTEQTVAAHSHRLVTSLMVGDVATARSALAASIRIADALRQPAHQWRVVGEEAMMALADGSLDEAEALVERALALGARAQRAEAITVHRVQRYTLHDFRGGLEAVEPSIREIAAEFPARPVLRCVLAHVHARLGRSQEARATLADLVPEGALPFDQEWLLGISLLAEAAALAADVDAVVVLYRRIEPWAALNAADPGEGMRGSMARYLGLLAATLGRFDDAERHFEHAIAMNAAMGAKPWLALSQRDFARVLLERDRERALELMEAAKATFRELGMKEG